MAITFKETSDIPETSERMEPIPGEKKRRGRPPGSRTGANVEKQLQDELTALGSLACMLWGARDPHCASVAAQQVPLIAGDLAKLAAKSKFAKAYLQKVADMGEIIPLIMHTYPIVMAIHEHHVKPKMNQNQEMSDVNMFVQDDVA